MDKEAENKALHEEAIDEVVVQITSGPKRQYIQAETDEARQNLASEVKKTVAQNDVVNDTLNRTGELLQLQNYFRKREQKVAEQVAAQVAVSAKAAGMEEMIIAAIQNNFQPEAIETMKVTAGITDTRLDELKKEAKKDAQSKSRKFFS